MNNVQECTANDKLECWPTARVHTPINMQRHALHFSCYRFWSVFSRTHIAPSWANGWNLPIQFIRIKCKSTLLVFITLHSIYRDVTQKNTTKHLFIGSLFPYLEFISTMVACHRLRTMNYTFMHICKTNWVLCQFLLVYRTKQFELLFYC